MKDEQFSYEVNLLCADGFCDEILCSGPCETPEEGRTEVLGMAQQQGWVVSVIDGAIQAYCGDHRGQK